MLNSPGHLLNCIKHCDEGKQTHLNDPDLKNQNYQLWKNCAINGLTGESWIACINIYDKVFLYFLRETDVSLMVNISAAFNDELLYFSHGLMKLVPVVIHQLKWFENIEFNFPSNINFGSFRVHCGKKFQFVNSIDFIWLQLIKKINWNWFQFTNMFI